ncbi:Single-stranded nucleic acid binding R3H protein isoform 2 [Hibiscus syriacus]|uniref:Single-stranded nucleic acid binding R3H protein isoform 2 n=1 Tax=Hibiscus syriacus TaxID=106335 RepID=A0A6A3A367_HIBSY|nr:cAMP-regulated phosphoprotein 21-like [Hibiscus syriacus]KAE8697742.1 Single-stranded nucleic acid binding R3H protein isoform 2 [Hibiscus syriacus]
MDLTSTTTISTSDAALDDKESSVDPFLVEALQNPRHRLTILRMELDIQKFLQHSDQQQFEFQHFPTSYLRLAAHRVAQHYGLITMVHDSSLGGVGSRIVAKRAVEFRCPAVRLSEIPANHSENDKSEQIKIAIKPRPNNGSVNEANQIGIKRSPVRSVEERKEEYDRARARIFSSPSSPDSDDSSVISIDAKNESPIRDACENYRGYVVDPEKNISARDGTSRVAIFRDREKDQYDPDYDRNYQRYVGSIPRNQSFGLAPYNMQKIPHPFMQYDSAFPQFGQIASTQPLPSYCVPATPAVSPFCDVGLNPTSGDGAYMQWPSATMMYFHRYDHFRHAVTQAAFCHQPLSSDYSQNG